MCPTSIAVWSRSAPPQFGQESPSASRGCRRTAPRSPGPPPRRAGGGRSRWRRRRTAPRAGSRPPTSMDTPTGPIEPDRHRSALDLVVRRRTDHSAEHGRELGFVEPVAADEAKTTSVGHHRHRLRRGGGIDAEQLGKAIDRSCRACRRARACRASEGTPARADAVRNLDVGGVVAALAGHEHVRTGLCRSQVVAALAAAHHSGLGLDRHDLEPQRSKIRS